MAQNTKIAIIGSFIWKFAERVLAQGISFVISLVLARLLSPDDYGMIALVLVFINLAYVFISSGFATALIQNKDADSTDFSTNFYCSFVCAIVIYIGIFFASPFVADFYENQELVLVLRVFALQIPLSAYNSIQNAYVARHMMFKKNFVSTVISTIISGTIGIAMAVLGYGVWALVAQSISNVIVSTIVLAIIVPWHAELKFSMQSAKNMMGYSSKLFAADLSGTFFNEVRSLIIGKVYTSADLAYYTKGQQIPNLITQNLSNTVMAVLFPALANESDDVTRVKNLTKRSLQLMSYIVFPALFGLAAVMEPLVLLLYTEKWSQSIPFAQLLCIGSAVGLLGIFPLQTLKAIGRSDIVLGLEIWKKPMYVLLLVIGVKINVLAIAIMMVIYDIYAMIVNMQQLKKPIHYGAGEQLLDIMPQLVLSAIMSFVVYIIPDIGGMVITLIIKVLVGVIVYLAGSIIMKNESFFIIKNLLLEKIPVKKKGENK
ncbi:MAG: lipopolysaccharide biosynthesis protein [Agathobacter sp.]|nr:lipopolysaccharide biosynthesis protein [Agathobacter sp.]